MGRGDEEEEYFTKRRVTKIIQEKENLLKKIAKILETAPEGTLKYQTRDGVTYYYLQKKNPETKKWEKTYLKKSQSNLIKQLARKSYLQKAKRVLEEQVFALTYFASIYDETALEQIYEDLPSERKQLITPIVYSIKEKMKEWNDEKYEPYDAYSEYKIYETDRGEMVRSKSEVIIANLLYQNRKDLDYKYERPLTLKDKSNKEVIIHPDFTIINKRTGNIYYYEHVGKLDEVRYATDFVKKMELYTINNIMPGKELLVTYEAAGAPLSVSCVRKNLNMCV